MSTTTVLGDYLAPQPKSKIKAGNGLGVGQYRFFTSSPIQSKFLNEYQYDDEALIFGTGGNASVHFCDEPFSSSTDCLVMYRKGDANIKFIYYYLQGNMHLLQNGFKGAGLKHISKGYILDIPICMPSRNKQDEVVATLDMISKTESILNSQLTRLDEIVKSRFVEMFGTSEQFISKANFKVKDICESRVGIVIKPTQYYVDDEKSGVKAFRSLNVKPFEIKDSDWVYFSEKENINLSRTQVHTNDVAVVRSGVNLGDSCVITEQYNQCNAIDILLLTCHDTVLPIYLCSFINFPIGKEQILNVQRGGAIKHINLKQLENADIFVPPIELQKEFAQFVAQTEKSKSAVTKCLQKAEYLKSALMQQYFG